MKRTFGDLGTIAIGFGAFAALATLSLETARATEILYLQDFEHPSGFVNDAADVNIYHDVNELYGDQPPGFSFAQANTVETLLVTGAAAFGTGYSDPSGKGGNHALGMLSSVEDDRIGLSFNVGAYRFLNFRLHVSSIDVSAWGGPFVPAEGLAPRFQVTLFDNPSGVAGLNGNETILDQAFGTGSASPRAVFDWKELVVALDASGNTNGNVTLQIDLVEGGYASLDNFRIAASDKKGDIGLDLPDFSTF